MPAQFHINYISVTYTIYIHYLYQNIISIYIIYIFIHSLLYSGVWACKLFYPVTHTCFDSFLSSQYDEDLLYKRIQVTIHWIDLSKHAQFYAIHMLWIVQLSVAYILSFISCICLYELIAMAWGRTSVIPVLTGVAAVLHKALVVWFCAWSACVWSLCVWVFYL